MTTVLASLNAGLHRAFEENDKVLLIGEDLLDPYGGAFKVGKGLSTLYPDRVLSSPISEAGLVGMAAGMALRGLRPIAEIMFGDFTTLIADQLINSIAKFQWMYNDSVSLPLVIRTPMGGRRGYGPTHSQTLEKLFLGIPGIKVIAPSHFGDPGELLSNIILASNSPTLFIENKLQYLKKLFEPSAGGDIIVEKSTDEFPTYKLSLDNAPKPDVTFATYGYMAKLTQQAMIELAYQHEIFCECIVHTQISPFDTQAVTKSVLRTNKLITIEEGTITHGWGAEIISSTATQLGPQLTGSARVAASDSPIPASLALENQMLPQISDIVKTAVKLSQDE